MFLIYYSLCCCVYCRIMHLWCSWEIQVEVAAQILHNYCFERVTNSQMFRSKCISSGVPKKKAELATELRQNLLRTHEPALSVVKALLLNFGTGKLKMNKHAFREAWILLYNMWQNVYTSCVKCVYVSFCTNVTWCFSMFHCWSLSLFASAFPPSFLCFKVSSSLPSFWLPVIYLSSFLYSCCFIWLPDLSSVISVHPLHFDVSPHATTKTWPLLTLQHFLAFCLSSNPFSSLYISFLSLSCLISLCLCVLLACTLFHMDLIFMIVRFYLQTVTLQF